jgi:UDP-N-acetylmuramyl pentapeptide phosphotransferase/UDP-N-acetylglucosamine-1-phosphate transferase
LRNYKAIQRIHLSETPRLGGFIFILTILLYSFFGDESDSKDILKLILLSLSPAIFFALKEDLYHNVKPTIRLISLLFSSWVFIENYSGSLPYLIDIPFVGRIILLQGAAVIFYTVGIASIANGMNMIDGVNGLCIMVAYSILCALLFLSHKTGDIAMLQIISTLMILIAPFALKNYPYGKIFLGDLGAYILGSILSILTIILFGRHRELSPYLAILVLIYPITEVIFTIIRRAIADTPVYMPDKLHLHVKIFNFLRSNLLYKKIASALVMPILSCLWLFPLFAVLWAFQNPIITLIAIIFFIFFYSFFYTCIPKARDIPDK